MEKQKQEKQQTQKTSNPAQMARTAANKRRKEIADLARQQSFKNRKSYRGCTRDLRRMAWASIAVKSGNKWVPTFADWSAKQSKGEAK
jgi:hypothetical protein